jgi:hypothetical protein
MEFGSDIFGNKYHWTLPGLTDELVFFRVGPGSDERKQRGAIRRSYQYEAVMLSKTVISEEIEPKLVQVESQAPVPVANKDGHMVKSEVGRLPFHVRSGRVRGSRSHVGRCHACEWHIQIVQPIDHLEFATRSLCHLLSMLTSSQK